VSTTTLQRLRLRRPDPADACPDTFVTGGPQLMSADVETSLERERARRAAARDQQSRVMADVLEEAGGPHSRFLHQRQGPAGACTDLDHVAVTPGGVWVIGAWQEPGARIEIAFSHGSAEAERERLLIRGRDKTQLVKGLAAQHEAVAAALAAYDVPVRGLVCFVDAQLPRFCTPTIQGYPVGDPGVVRELLRAPGSVGTGARRAVRKTLAEAFPTL